MTEIDLRYTTAVHEAGHAVIGRVLSMQCGGVSIVQDEDSYGHATTHDPWAIHYSWEARGKWRDSASVFRGRILTFMAGAEAENEFFGAASPGDWDDRTQVSLMLEEVTVPVSTGDPEEDLDKYEARLRRKARALVVRHRAAIQTLADQLLVRKTLAPAEVDQILRDQGYSIFADRSLLEIVTAED